MEMTAVEGMMNYFSLLIYQMVWGMAEKKDGFVAVECGVSVGNSTVAILAGLERARNGQLWSYDIQINDTAFSNVDKAGLSHRWIFSKTDSLNAVGDWPEDDVDFLFLDTDHEYENTKKELEAWAPKVCRGGRILLHDTLTTPDGVGLAIKEFLYKNRAPDSPSSLGRALQRGDWQYYNIDVCCGLGVLIKP